MIYPEKPTCHGDPHAMRFADHFIWRETEPDGRYPTLPQRLRKCGYCGSIHPEDLVLAIERGAVLGGSDWKYGWPHKFYVTIPNPHRDERAVIGQQSRWDDEQHTSIDTLIYGSAGDYTAKWYNAHLNDDGFDDEAFAYLVSLLYRETDIQWDRSTGRLRYSAPSFGYQRLERGLR